ncbi:MAG: hypothetical protein K2J08_02455 [Ruminococcus sp.]|nr:hypothetical protein [Ruminococcus sp.]
MASEAVRKILEAEADSEKKNSEALKRSDEIISEAERYSALAVQKKISEALAESAKIREEYRKKLAVRNEKTEADCLAEISKIRFQAEKNAENAINAVIERFF